jgi:transcriptional regulator GlxA family with amidase domain
MAADWGFGHLGEFAQAYRQQFGESPSRTRAVPDAGPPAGGQRAGDPEA